MENKIESFELDHTKVTAPYIRKAMVFPMKEYVNNKGESAAIAKFDVRFTQPNKKFMSNDAIHSLEHLLAICCRNHTDDLIDISPMGCRTGFYFIFLGDKDVHWVINVVTMALRDILNMDEIPAAKEISCGNYLEHDIDITKLWARRFLSVSADKLAVINRI